MIQRKFYLPEELYGRLQLRAKIAGKTITDILRELIDEGLRRKERESDGRGAKALLELARLAERKRLRGPSDLSVRHDEYFVKAWEEDKKQKK